MKGNNSMKVCFDENVLLDSQKVDYFLRFYILILHQGVSAKL
mgnify:CR=1 FL=1